MNLVTIILLAPFLPVAFLCDAILLISSFTRHERWKCVVFARTLTMVIVAAIVRMSLPTIALPSLGLEKMQYTYTAAIKFEILNLGWNIISMMCHLGILGALLIAKILWVIITHPFAFIMLYFTFMGWLIQ